jgi:hypothetical protein
MNLINNNSDKRTLIICMKEKIHYKYLNNDFLPFRKLHRDLFARLYDVTSLVFMVFQLTQKEPLEKLDTEPIVIHVHSSFENTEPSSAQISDLRKKERKKKEF